MNDTIERLERSLRAIADDIEFDADVDRHPAIPRHPERRPVPALAWAAAALVVVAGGVGVWSVTGRSPAPSAGPESAAVELDPTSAQPPPASTAATTTGFTVPEPADVAVLDPALGAGDFTREDPVDRWFVGIDPPPRWYVRAADDGSPSGALSVELSRPTEWGKSFDDGEPVGTIGGAELRLMADSAIPTVGWQTDDGVRMVRGVGDVSEDEVITAALAAAEGADAFAGFDEVPAPANAWTTAVYTSEAGATWSAVAVTLSEPTDGTALDAGVTALMTPGDAEQRGDAWVVSGAFWDGSLVIIDLPDGRQATVYLHESSGIAPSSVVSAVQVVPAETVPPDQTMSVIVADGEIIDGGTVSRGRWIITLDREPGATAGPTGTQCLSFATSWAGGGTMCGTPETLSERCAFGNGYYIELGDYWIALVPARSSAVAVLLDGTDTVPATSIERIGDYKLAMGTTPEGWFGSPNSTIQVLVDGRVCPSG